MTRLCQCVQYIDLTATLLLKNSKKEKKWSQNRQGFPLCILLLCGQNIYKILLHLCSAYSICWYVSEDCFTMKQNILSYPEYPESKTVGLFVFQASQKGLYIKVSLP